MTLLEWQEWGGVFEDFEPENYIYSKKDN